MNNVGTYRETVSEFTRWALGQRLVHDLVVHPLMAITMYSDWSLKLHDYHSFSSMKPGDKRSIGIMGRVDDVRQAFDDLGIPIRQIHADGVICCGIGEPSIGPEHEKKNICDRCDGRGGYMLRRGSEQIGN